MKDIYEDILDSIEDGIIVLDEAQRVTFFNQASERITGLSKNRVAASPVGEVFGNNPQIIEQVRKTFETGQVFSDYDTHILKRDGSVLPVSLITSPIMSGEGERRGTVLVVRDISRLKILEEDIRRSDSLASVGILAAGLAHEIRNPLGGIRGAAQLLQMEVGDDEELREYTSVIIRETERVSGLLEELLDFANPKKLDLREVNIHEILDSVIALLTRGDEGRGVRFITEYDPSIPLLIGDRGKLSQVFLNIMKNGCEVMEGSGTLRVTTRVMSDFLLHEGEGIRSKMMAAEITDEGGGIPEEEMKSLFTPFFTRKKGGTGLGLAISHRIVREHKGIIKVKSRQGEGSTFSVFLPLR